MSSATSSPRRPRRRGARIPGKHKFSPSFNRGLEERYKVFKQPKVTGGPHLVGFAHRYCRHTKGQRAGTPIDFEPFQRAVWDEGLETTESGRRLVRYIIQGRPRKNYKSAENAVLAMYLAGPDGEPEADVYLGAASKDQAEIVFGQARSFVQVKGSPLTRHYTAMQTVITYPRLRGKLQKVSSEGFLAHGLNPHGVVLDELHAFKTEAQLELYRAMTTGHGLRLDPLIASITTAGYDKQTLLGEIYDSALRLPDAQRVGPHDCLLVARDPASGLLLVWFGAPDGADIENREIWRACNPAGDLTMEFLEEQWALCQSGAGGLRVNDFCRLHLNMWTASKDRWIPDDVWFLTRQDEEDAIPNEGRIGIGVDAAITHDTAAVAWSWRDEYGNMHDRVRVWSCRNDVPHDVYVPGGRIDLELLEDFITEVLVKKYQVLDVAYDPEFFEQSATRLARKGLRIAPIPQGSLLNRQAVRQFYIDTKEERTRTLKGRAGDTLQRHVQNTAAIPTESGYKLAKLKTSSPFDAVPATVWAHWRASQRNESVYEERALRILGEDPADTDEDDDWEEDDA